MPASVHQALGLLVLVVFASTRAQTVADAAILCSDASMTAAYKPVRTLMDACERTFKVPLNTTLSAPQKSKLCDACPMLLAAVEKPDSLPTCIVALSASQVLSLRKLLERQFRRCLTSASTSDSDAGSLGADDAAPSPAPSNLRTSTNSPTNLEASGAPNTSAPSSTGTMTTVSRIVTDQIDSE